MQMHFDIWQITQCANGPYEADHIYRVTHLLGADMGSFQALRYVIWVMRSRGGVVNFITDPAYYALHISRMFHTK